MCCISTIYNIKTNYVYHGKYEKNAKFELIAQ